MERAVDHFANLAANNASEPKRLLADLDALQRVHRWATEHGRWDQAIAMGRPVGNALALSGRWRSWEAVLDRTLEAARISGNRAAEGWALNELGARALGLGHDDVARTSLETALRIRESIGDRLGADITRHNLSHLIAPPAISQHDDGGDGQTRPDGGRSIFRTIFTSIVLIGTLAALVFGAITIFGSELERLFGSDDGGVIAGQDDDLTPSPTPIETNATATPEPTRTPTPVATPTRTPPATPEPTRPPVTVPVITLHPESLEIYEGDVAEFYTDARGDPRPTVQWQVSQDSGRTWQDLTGETDTRLEFISDILDDGNLYRSVFRTEAGSATSRSAELRVIPLPPEAPEITDSAGSGDDITIFWESFDETVTGFIVQRSFDESPFVSIAQLPADEYSYNDTDLEEGYEVVSYRVAAFNEGGQSDFSEPWSVSSPLSPNQQGEGPIVTEVIPPDVPSSIELIPEPPGVLDIILTPTPTQETEIILR
jgi:hypothetical protein